ncbi:MAG: sulfotransferase domain-containing protein [Chloroflexota bacterium]
MRITRRVKRLLRPHPRARQNSLRRARGKEPPVIPDGWTLGPPDFIGVGVQKAGTTWWWKLLMEHPDVVGTNKETHQLTRLGWRPVFAKDIEAYHRHFPRPEGAMTGEWTPRYMTVAGVAETMKAIAPEARILVLLRDPVERYRSGVGQWQKHKERRGMRLNLWAGRKDAYARSFYGFTLAPYVEAFGRERVLILQLERCQLDPAGEYKRTLKFLGLREWVPDEEVLGRPVNVSKKRPSPKVLDEPADLVESLEGDVKLLMTLAPELDVSLWRNFAHLGPGKKPGTNAEGPDTGAAAKE